MGQQPSALMIPPSICLEVVYLQNATLSTATKLQLTLLVVAICGRKVRTLASAQISWPLTGKEALAHFGQLSHVKKLKMVVKETCD